MDMRNYNKLQSLRTKLCAVEAELHDMAVCGRDLPKGKERSVLHAQYSMRAKAREFYRLSIEELLKEVCVEY